MDMKIENRGGRMTEQEAIKNINTYIYSELESIPKQLLESLKLACFTLKEVEQYRAIGTVSELQDLVIGINALADSQFSAEDMAKLVNDMKSLYEYQQIGTPEECLAAVEKQKADKELESHDEKHILKSCLGLMQDMVDEFAEWYRWQHGEDSIEKLDDEEIFCIRKTYFRIVQELFLLHTNHSGGTSTRAKCKQLGVDWGEEIEFDWSDEE